LDVAPGPGREAGSGAATDPELLAALARAAALCNDAVLHEEGGVWRVEGDPMEGALLALAGKIGAPGGDRARRDAIPFDAAHRYMAVLVDAPEGGAELLVKGAPEAVLALCADRMAPGGGTVPIVPADWHRKVEELAADGLRVLALARRAMPAGQEGLSHDDLAGRLSLIGLRS
ncbi:cation-transporting P-type ATPase, partial [Rhodovulum sulfidophilum]|nr:cation-transporting P-type ATPase [Rhodovulum sulfidophilum]